MPTILTHCERLDNRNATDRAAIGAGSRRVLRSGWLWPAQAARSAGRPCRVQVQISTSARLALSPQIRGPSVLRSRRTGYLCDSVGQLVPSALRAVARGGTVVCAGIHMSDIPSFPYHLLWGERVVRSVANLTRRDGEEFLAIAPKVPIRAAVQTFPLAGANETLERLRTGQIKGAAVLLPPHGSK